MLFIPFPALRGDRREYQDQGGGEGKGDDLDVCLAEAVELFVEREKFHGCDC